MPDICIKPWQIEHTGPVTPFTESLFAIGNGCLGVRGFSTQARKSAPWDHALFRAGLYDRIRPGITDLVQLPDVLHLPLGPGDVERQRLDLQTGVLTQGWGQISCERMVSMADKQLICLRFKIGGTGTYSADPLWDTQVRNLPVNDDQMIDHREPVQLLEVTHEDARRLCMQTLHLKRRITFLTQLFLNGQPFEGGSFQAPCVLEKHVRILLDEEPPNPDSPDPWEANRSAWQRLWQDCDIRLEASHRIQGAVRYNIFQLLCNNAAQDPRVSIGARGLTHGRYKGNTFWDTDIFLLPFYCWHRPEAAGNLVRYRLDRLEDAQRLARRQNLQGARFPWMCALDGLEQCESWDIGLCETHITADVAYAVDRYTQITGAPVTPRMQRLFCETARYWHSRFTWEEGRQQYSSFFVKGPDEYCGAAVNNTYTNYMARHNVRLALDHETNESLAHFASHIALLYDPARSLYLQDELFERLEPLPSGRREGGPLYKTICFDRMQRYRALKQADLVQLMVLFPQDFTPEQKKAVWDFYEPLTVHDSTLSFGAHAHLAFQLGLTDEAWRYFEKSLFLDLEDGLGNTGREGIHMAALGATWQALVYGALGLWTDKGRLTLTPRLPPRIRALSLRVYHRGERLRIEADHQNVRIEKEA